jgi:hypothetical protein
MNLISALFLFALSQTPQARAPGDVILDAAVAELRKDEPSWKLTRGSVCNFPPLIEEQEKIFCGLWHRDARTPPQDVFASFTLHYVSDAAMVTRYLETWRARLAQMPAASFTPYDIGVPAYLGTYGNGSQLEILFGRGRFLFSVSGKSKADIERIAKAVLRQIDAR